MAINKSLDDFSFCITFYTKIDLREIKEALENSELNFSLYYSNFNNKYILKSNYDENFLEWNLDSSNSNVFFASGSIHATIEKSKSFISEIADVLKKSNIGYDILLDYENGEKTFKLESSNPK